MSILGLTTASQMRKKMMELLDQMNHYIDLRGLETRIWDATTEEWIDNPHNATIDRLENELKKWYSKGNANGVNWNKLPQHYQNWLNGYLMD